MLSSLSPFQSVKLFTMKKNDIHYISRTCLSVQKVPLAASASLAHNTCRPVKIINENTKPFEN